MFIKHNLVSANIVNISHTCREQEYSRISPEGMRYSEGGFMRLQNNNMAQSVQSIDIRKILGYFGTNREGLFE